MTATDVDDKYGAGDKSTGSIGADQPSKSGEGQHSGGRETMRAEYERRMAEIRRGFELSGDGLSQPLVRALGPRGRASCFACGLLK